MMQTRNATANTVVAGGASNVLWAWEQDQIDGEEAMQNIQRLFAAYRKEFGL